jgi:hypothetical protein
MSRRKRFVHKRNTAIVDSFDQPAIYRPSPALLPNLESRESRFEFPLDSSMGCSHPCVLSRVKIVNNGKDNRFETQMYWAA